MTEPRALPERKLRILHVLSPGREDALRGVADLARRQSALGHAVGLVIGSDDEPALRSLLGTPEPHFSLGVHLTAKPNGAGFGTLVAAAKVERLVRRLAADVVHGHGGRGGFLAHAAALLRRHGAVRCYTPSGETASRGTGLVRLGCERLLAAATDLVLFESVFLANRYRRSVGETRAMVAIVPDGIGPEQRVRVTADADAADLLYVGEIRLADGLDMLIDALAILQRRLGRAVRLALVGAGPARAGLEAHARSRGVAESLRILDPIPARHAFARGRILVAPTRVDRLPHVAVEAAAAQVPMVACDIGGIGEIFGPYRDRLVPADDPMALAKALERLVEAEPADVAAQAADLAAHVGARFASEATTRAVINAYRDAIARRTPTTSVSPRIAPAST